MPMCIRRTQPLNRAPLAFWPEVWQRWLPCNVALDVLRAARRYASADGQERGGVFRGGVEHDFFKDPGEVGEAGVAWL